MRLCWKTAVGDEQQDTRAFVENGALVLLQTHEEKEDKYATVCVCYNGIRFDAL